VLSPDRKKRFFALPDNILVHDLRNPLPYESEVDAVYRSHLLEHLDKPIALGFIKENYRVLKSGGILRVVVPDLYSLVEGDFTLKTRGGNILLYPDALVYKDPISGSSIWKYRD